MAYTVYVPTYYYIPISIDEHVDRFRVVRVSIIIIVVVVVELASVFFLTRFIIIFYIILLYSRETRIKIYVYMIAAAAVHCCREETETATSRLRI